MSGENGNRDLTIREVSARSGVSEGTLRMWETRYSFPSPQRLASGHRRYSEQDLEQVRAVVRARAQGLSLRTAIGHARTLSLTAQPSVFSALRETFPELRPQVMTKRALVSLTHAIEDESCARAQRPLLIGCFQQERFYRQAQQRWRELARTSRRALVLADFARNQAPELGPVEVALRQDDAMMREWVLVCDAEGFCGCLVGWERLGEPGAERCFEAVWTVEPPVVRAAARVCCELVSRSAPEHVQDLSDHLARPATPLGSEVRPLIDLTSRMVLYVTGAGCRG